MLLARTLRTIPGQVAGPLAQMASAVAFTHWLSPDALGVYALAWATQELAYYGVLAWWSAFVQRYAIAHQDPEGRARLNSAESAVHLFAAALQTVIASLAIMLVLGDLPSFGFVAALAVFTVTRNLSSHFAGRARAEGVDGAFTILQCAGPVGGLALAIFALSQISATADAVLIAYAIAQTIGLVFGLPMMRFSLVQARLDRTMLKASLVYGAPLIVANLLEWVANHGVRVIVEFTDGAEAVGLVTIAWWLGLRITTFMALLVTGATFAAAVNRMEAEGPEGARKQLSDNCVLLLALLAPATVGGALLAVPFAELVVAEPFRVMTAALLPLALVAGAAKAFREHGPEQAFLVFSKTHSNAMTSIVEAGGTVVCCIAGLYIADLYGAIAGCAIASVISGLFSHVYAARSVGYYISLADLARIIGATSAMAGAVLLLPEMHGWSGLALAVVTGGVAYAAACLGLWWHHAPWASLKAQLGRRSQPLPDPNPAQASL